MAPFGKFPSQSFIQWDFYQEAVDQRSPFWRIASEGIFENFVIQYDPENGENWILIPFVTAEGAGIRKPFAAADGDIEIPLLLLSGVSGGSGSIAIFPVRVSGTGSDGTGVIIGDGGYGSASIGLAVNGSGYTNEKGNADITIPFILVAGYQGSITDITIHMLRVSGYGLSGQQGGGSFSVPVITADGYGYSAQVGTGIVVLPAITALGTGSTAVIVVNCIGTADITIHPLRITGVSYHHIAKSTDIILTYKSSRRYI